MQVINDTLIELMLGEPAVYWNLAVFPLLSGKQWPVDYLTLDEALEQEGAVVMEVSGEGHVPELQFENRMTEKILLLDGDELAGAKQNRVLNLTILVGPRHKVVIPVSCVEHGRWAYQTHRFASAKRNLYGSLKAKKMAAVTMSMRERNSRVSDQHEIWNDIARKFDRMGSRSDTDAMGDLYEDRENRLNEYQQAFKPVTGQVGAVFAIEGEVAGLELFDNEATLAKTFRKLVGSFAMDALEIEDENTAVPDKDDVMQFLERIKQAELTRHTAVDLGLDIRLSGDQLVGGALIADERIIHLSAFNLPGEKMSGGLDRVYA